MCFSQKHFRSWGDENERQMENNVNCKEMRFVIRNLVDVDDVSPATALEIGIEPRDYLDLILPNNGARNWHGARRLS